MPQAMPSKSVFSWLDGVRARPSMYIVDESLHDLENLLYGYYAGLGMHGVVENVPQMTYHFLDWLYWRTSWSTSRGWANAITNNARKRRPLDVFFELVDRYRELRPVTLRSVRPPEHTHWEAR